MTSSTLGQRSSDQNLNLGLSTEAATLYSSAYRTTPLQGGAYCGKHVGKINGHFRPHVFGVTYKARALLVVSDFHPLPSRLYSLTYIFTMTSKYEAIHQSLGGPGDARPTAAQIVADNELQGKWSDKTILITGCSSGIGVETARALADTGATLYLTARDLNKAKNALGSILDSPRIQLLELDLNSLASVRSCAAAFLKSSRTLNILIANAGIMANPEGRTADGFETQFGTNHLAHFLLIQLLLPRLQDSTTAAFHSRVVILSSSAHRHGGINFSNLNLEGEYHPWVAYGQSKTANLYTASELERRYGSKGVHAWSVHPGLIMTGLVKHVPDEMLEAWAQSPDVGKVVKSVEQGAATTVWAAVAKDLEGKGGKYLENCQVAKPVQKEDFQEWDPGYLPYAYDQEKETLLWEKSVELIEPFLA